MTPHTFSEFWTYYVTQHLDPQCRQWHFTGTALAAGFVLLAMLRTPAWPYLLAAPIVGYACSWYGHFTHEHNRPASWQGPRAFIYSLLCDFRMASLILRGQMDAEVERVRREMQIEL